VRNTFFYNGFNQLSLLKALLHISEKIDYIGLLISNTKEKNANLPKDYINYDIIAGVGSYKMLVSNNNSFEKLSHFHSQNKDWLFGYLSYDLKNEIEELASNNIDNFKADNLCFFAPEYVLLLKDSVLEIQTYHSKDICDVFVQSFSFVNFLACDLKINLKRRDTRSAYLQKIEKIKNHIQRGDIYELNYCQEFYASGVAFSPESVFLDLNELMQTPFASFLKLKDKYVLSASPERFLRKESSHILSQPIKGTRKRGVDRMEDDELLHELKKSEKDISENIMITDLVRNDLSITAKKSSVKIDELCRVYTFEKVHQMITSVCSEIEKDIDFTQVIKSTFPMGSMTGAPKIRAMELIEYFESFKRGAFSGAIGYIAPNSDFDFNVVIRTILYNLAENYLSIGVGGAITMQSNPIEEYEECLVKAAPLFEVLNCKIS